MPLCEPLGVGDEQVVADELHRGRRARSVSELPAVPVVLAPCRPRSRRSGSGRTGPRGSRRTRRRVNVAPSPARSYAPSAKSSVDGDVERERDLVARRVARALRSPRRSSVSASSFDGRFGAKPPSSPSAVESPRSCRSAFSAWYVSAPQRSASAKLAAPTGASMNSWMSTLLSACAPPLSTFMQRHRQHVRVRRRRRSGTAAGRVSSAAALAAASDTPRIALAPRRPLFGGAVEAARARRRAGAGRSRRARATASAISPLTCSTAVRTPLPP